MKFEELSKDRQDDIIETNREINIDFDWWNSTLDNICEQVKDKAGLEIKPQDLGFEFFSKGSSGLWIKRSGLFDAISDKYDNIEDLDIGEDFGVWAYVGLRQDEINKEDILLEEEDDTDDLTELFQEREQEKEKNGIINKVETLLDIFSKGYSDLYEEYGYLTSDEAIKETIKINEMEFDEDL